MCAAIVVARGVGVADAAIDDEGGAVERGGDATGTAVTRALLADVAEGSADGTVGGSGRVDVHQAKAPSPTIADDPSAIQARRRFELGRGDTMSTEIECATLFVWSDAFDDSIFPEAPSDRSISVIALRRTVSSSP